MGNSYFNYKQPQNPLGELEEKKVVSEKDQEFKQYEEKPENGFQPETKPGFTSIIIPAFFNSYPIFHQTGHCIGSIREHTNYIDTPYEIILIVNGDTGIKINDLKDYKVDKVIENKENLGFAKAVNQGIRCASGEYIAVVNNDTMVFNGWLQDMQEALKYLDLVQATPLYGMPFARAVEAEEERNKWLEKPIQESFSDFKDFSCVLTKKELFNKVGLFDEQFFAYSEDVDLIRRIEEIGGKVASTKRVRTFHIISGTASGMKDTPNIMNESKEKLRIKYEQNKI